MGVGDQGLVTQAVGVEEVVAGTGMRLLPAHHHPRPFGLGRDINRCC